MQMTFNVVLSNHRSNLDPSIEPAAALVDFIVMTDLKRSPISLMAVSKSDRPLLWFSQSTFATALLRGISTTFSRVQSKPAAVILFPSKKAAEIICSRDNFGEHLPKGAAQHFLCMIDFLCSFDASWKRRHMDRLLFNKACVNSRRHTAANSDRRLSLPQRYRVLSKADDLGGRLLRRRTSTFRACAFREHKGLPGRPTRCSAQNKSPLIFRPAGFVLTPAASYFPTASQQQ